MEAKSLGFLLLALAFQPSHALVLPPPHAVAPHSAPRNCWSHPSRAPAPCLVDKEKLLGEAASIEKYAEMISKIDGRTARKILYGVFALGSAAGLSTALPELVSVASGSSTDVGLGEAVAGVVVDGLTLGACVLGFKIDTGEAVAAAEVEAKDAGIPTASAMDVSALGVEVLTESGKRRPAVVGALQAEAQRSIIVLAGPGAWVKECVKSARFVSEVFTSGDVLIVPVPLDGAAAGAGEAKGFGAGSAWTDAAFVALPAAADEAAWREQVGAELAEASRQGADVSAQGIVLAVDASGAVVQRRLGVPEWRPFVTTLRPNRFDNTEVRRAKSIIG